MSNKFLADPDAAGLRTTRRNTVFRAALRIWSVCFRERCVEETDRHMHR